MLVPALDQINQNGRLYILVAKIFTYIETEVLKC